MLPKREEKGARWILWGRHSNTCQRTGSKKTFPQKEDE